MKERIILATGINGDELLRSLAANNVNCFNVRIMNAVGLARYGLSFIPREKNRKADQLGRTRMLLDMPISAYNEAVKNKIRVKELEKRVKQLEAEKNTDTEIPEVIVAKQVSYPDKPKGKLLFFDNIFRYIRSRFDEAFGRKVVSNL